MAEIEVQPKKKSSGSFLPWLLLALGVIALVFFLTRNGDRNEAATTATTTDTTTYSSTSDNAARGGWDGVDYDNAPRAEYNEVRNNDIDVRGNENYAIYRVNENNLFDNDQARLNRGSEERLREIAQSINTRFSNGEVRVYRAADGDDATENQRSQQRAEAVKDWLTKNGLTASNVTVHAHNRQGNNNSGGVLGIGGNNRIEIVAMRAQ
jgi:outer membrane protein OmpA-like peptidoglycan-associated protein